MSCFSALAAAAVAPHQAPPTVCWAALTRALAAHCWLSYLFAHAGLLHALSQQQQAVLDTALASAQTAATLTPVHAAVSPLPGGLWLVLYPILTVVVGENTGLVAGALLSRLQGAGAHRPFPTLSPRKTTVGYAAQVAGSALSAAYLGAPERVCLNIMLGAAFGVVGAAGDLVESLFKRAHERKDAGAWLPGWGGLLDRLDGILFAFPLTFYIYTLFTPY